MLARVIVVLALASLVTPALGCPKAAKRERAVGHVTVSDVFASPVRLAYGHPSKVLVRYPRFTDGSILYQAELAVVTDARVWKLYDELEAVRARHGFASVTLTLERADADTWRIVGWKRS